MILEAPPSTSILWLYPGPVDQALLYPGANGGCVPWLHEDRRYFILLWREKKEKEGPLGQLQVYECLPCMGRVHRVRQAYGSSGDAAATVAAISEKWKC